MKQKIAIIGTGLIGGSLGLALKQAKIEAEIVGHDRDTGTAALAKKRGAVDKTDWNLLNAVDGASLVILAMPATAIKSTLEAIASTVQAGAIITDTASTKQQVLAWAEQILPPGVHFVGGHPLAGADAAGIAGASAELFHDTTYCLMPARTAGEKALETMTNLVNLIGARPYFVDPAEHDAFVAAVSHLPFLAATALVRTAAGSVSWAEIRRVAGVDFERASVPLMAEPQIYSDVCQTNKEPILRWLDEYVAALGELRSLIEEGGPALLAAFTAAQEARAKWIATRNQDMPDEDRPQIEGTSAQFRQIFMGNLGAPRPLPGEKK